MNNQPPPPYPGSTDQAYPPGEMKGYPQGPPPAQAPPGPYPPPPPAYGPPPGGVPPAGYGQPMSPYSQQQPYGPPQGYGMGPAQPGYQPPPTVIVHQPMVTTVVQTFRDAPVTTVCPHCRAQIVTATQFETGTFTYLLCAVICLVGCDLGCCFIPFCVDGCKDVIHTCPNCNREVSRWTRL